jgi:hypothetical protein
MGNYHIRALVDSDFDGCMDLYRYLHAEDDTLPPLKTLRSTWNRMIDNSQVLYPGAFVDKPVSRCMQCTDSIESHPWCTTVCDNRECDYPPRFPSQRYRQGFADGTDQKM